MKDSTKLIVNLWLAVAVLSVANWIAVHDAARHAEQLSASTASLPTGTRLPVTARRLRLFPRQESGSAKTDGTPAGGGNCVA